ncbi:TonB-linked outer membrane protein, SusC/RagA family [Salegentibacter echinorum]|uniref:TonB-linked outer membrane protein, SusC/RagA family n=1 Tax=Salegentibacter echinorum TaxID=1073325 RepID=A0A1M5E3Q9_SALEC|nr:TonB-dependent receptor [Salegentibacter echinorum]SHF73825.1 TonB-linked outer membrane protein, SusC/RagA family [Salegentibacter echinorum]
MKKPFNLRGFANVLLKPDLKMKLTYFLFICCFLQIKAGGYAQDVNVDIHVRNANMLEVFNAIENQTNFRFFYNQEELGLTKRISLDVEKEKLSNVLKYLFKGTDNKYEVFKNQIIISKALPVVNEIKAQEIVVTGRVTDKDGNPLYGVAVIEKSTNMGTATNEEGEYRLKVQDTDQTLIFSYLGFKKEEVALAGRIKVDIQLIAELGELDQVVLIGYGKQKRSAVSGAVSSIGSGDIENTSTGTIGFDRALGGLAKGVQVSQNTGRPGAPIRLNIRGYTSPLSGSLNQPLYVIDGVPFNIDALPGTFSGGTSNPLLAISPDNIESIDILKDAAATAIYGSRGANGVVIVKTKSGENNQKPSINFSYNTTIAQPINTLDPLNSKQYKNFYDGLISNSVPAVNSGRLPFYTGFDLANLADVPFDPATGAFSYNGLLDDRFGDEDINFNDEVYRDFAITNQANFGISGGSENTNYTFGISGSDQEGLVINDEFKLYNTRAAVNTDISDRVTAGVSLNLGYNKSESGEGAQDGQYNVNTANILARPDFPFRDDNGELIPLPDYQFGFPTFEPSPVARLQHKNKSKNYNFIGNGYLEVEALKNLNLKAEINAAFFDRNSSIFTPGSTLTNFGAPNNSYLTTSKSTSTNLTTNLTANYTFALADHNFDLLAGYAWDRTEINTESYFYLGFPDEDILINPGSAEEVLGYNNSDSENGINSFFSRLSYDYKDRYTATLNFRTDASSKFGPGNKRGYFPSLSAGWNIANEDFLKNNKSVNNLKLRASIGKVGSANIRNFAYLQFFSTTSSDLYGGSTAIVASNTLPNRDVGWETTKEINVGLDWNLLDYRLRGSIDVYKRDTEGALAPTPIPYELGPSNYVSNLMDVSNEGMEISLGGDIIRTQDFTWSLDANWAYNRNVLESLNGANINQYNLDYYIEGEPVGTIKGYEVAKILETQEEVDELNANAPTGQYDRASLGVGDFMFKDTNGDGEITTRDRVKIGSIEPDFFGGFNTKFSFKNISLSSYFQYSVGAESVWSAITSQPANYLGPNKLEEYALNTWTPENPDARYARTIYTDPSRNARLNDRYMYDSSYLRLKYLQLAYNFDEDFLKALNIKNLSVFISGSNLFTVTDWPGVDPESFSERGTITDGANNEDPYPLAKSYSLGVQLQF